MKKLKRNKGDILDSVLISTMGLIALSILIIGFIKYSKDTFVSFQLQQTTRNYLLKMESKGYLDTTNKDSLYTELEGLGIYDIDLSGCTTVKVNYGDDVYLSVKGKYDISDYSFDSFKLSENKKTIDIDKLWNCTGKN